MIREINRSTESQTVLSIYDGVRHRIYAFDDLEDAKKVLEMLGNVFGSPVVEHSDHYWTVSGDNDRYAELLQFPF